MRNAVIYTRVSTDDQARNNMSLQGQRDACEAFAAAKSIAVNEVFVEAGESAKTAERTKLIEMINFCTKNKDTIDYVIVWKVDRLARRAGDHHVIKSTLKKYGITLLSVTEPIEDTVTGRLMETILAGFAQFDNEVRAERSANGMKARLQEGGWPFVAPIGYMNFRDVLGRPTLKKDAQSNNVRKLLLKYLNSPTNLRELHEYSKQIGITTRNGKYISYQNIILMLKNPIYAGIISSGLLDVAVPGLHEPLINEDEHLDILNKLQGKKKAISRSKSLVSWPLRGGFIECFDCSGVITGSSPRGNGGIYHQYHCTKCRASVVGHKVSVPRERLHREFVDILRSMNLSHESVQKLEQSIKSQYKTATYEARKDIRRLNSELEKLEKKREKIIDLLIDGQLDVKEKEDACRTIDSQITQIKLDLSEKNSSTLDEETLLDFSLSFLTKLDKIWESCGVEDAQRFQQVLFPKGLKYDFVKGFRTPEFNHYISKIGTTAEGISNLVGPAGLEPATNRL